MAVVHARRWIRKMQGDSQAQLVEADDQNYYVVKPGHWQGARVLANEWIAAFLLRQLGILSPEFAIIEVDADFLSGNAEAQLGEGLFFGSRYPGVPGEIAVYDFLPDTLYSRLSNRPDFVGILAFDKWVSNADGRQAIFFRTTKGAEPRWAAQVIDNGAAFQGGDWTFRDSPVQGLYARTAVYGDDLSMLQVWPWIHRILCLKAETFDQAITGVPSPWIAGDEPALARLMSRLDERRAVLPDLVNESVSWVQDHVSAKSLTGEVF